MSEIKLSYGIKEGKVVHISQVSFEENGLKCGCICPLCKQPLIAKRCGTKRIPHFAHANTSNCDILHAQESGLHLFAKEIIKNSKSILFPGWTISRDMIIPESLAKDPLISDIFIEEPHSDSKECTYSSALLEQQIDDIRPDIIIQFDNGRKCAIEIAVTHPVGIEKTKKVESLELPMFEIDLKPLVNKTDDRDTIFNAVLLCPTNRRWIYNPRQVNELNKNRKQFQQDFLDLLFKKKERERIEIERKEKEKQRFIQIKELAIASLKAAFLPTNYKKGILKLRNDKQASYTFRSFSFSKELATYPFYMDIPIRGEFVFSCDRRIWQGTLFDKYVYSCPRGEKTYFYVPEIVEQITNNCFNIHFNQECVFPITTNILGDAVTIDLPNDVIKKYFNYLSLLGFIHLEDECYGTSTQPDSLSPPNKELAAQLESIINTVDQYDPNIDNTIATLLQKDDP